MKEHLLLIKDGFLLNPSDNEPVNVDILVKDGIVEEIKKGIEVEGAEVIDAKGRYVFPGFIDMHTHLREPGREDEETIETGLKAAAHGGFTTIMCMPNTNPAIDNEGVVRFVLDKAKEAESTELLCCGCITKGRMGKELTEMMQLKKAGCVAISDDGDPVEDSYVMRRALEYSKMCGLRVISHCEDKNLAMNGWINEGVVSTKLGIRGIPKEAEEIMVAREIYLSKLTNTPVHIAHISTKGSVELIRRAKEDGIQVTCETAPHYFILDETYLQGFDSNFKVNPPLRTKEDVEAIIEGLADGTIDVIATDHAPHADFEKMMEFEYAPFGMIGLETAAGLVFTYLFHTGRMPLNRIIEKFTTGPSKVLGLDKGILEKGSCADITIVDLERTWEVVPEKFFSKSCNTPFKGWILKGSVTCCISKGRIVWDECPEG